MILVFRFAALIVVGIVPHLVLGRVELLLKSLIDHRPERIQIAEIVVPFLDIAGSVGARGLGTDRIQPAVWGDIELGPIVHAHL